MDKDKDKQKEEKDMLAQKKVEQKRVMSASERKALIRQSSKQVFKQYDNTFRKLSKS